MTLIVQVPPSYPDERQYILYVLLGEFLGLDYVVEVEDRSDILITLRGDSRQKQLTLVDELFTIAPDQWLSQACMPKRPWPWIRPNDFSDEHPEEWALPVLYGAGTDRDRCANYVGASVTPTSIQLNIDLLGSCFFLLTRLEETVVKDRDAHGRFAAASSIVFKEGLLERPLVNEYLELLFWALERLWPDLTRTSREFQFLLSHDVDLTCAAKHQSPWSVLLSTGADVLLRNEATTAVKRATSYAAVRSGKPDRDVFNTFDWMMDLSEQRGLSSAFYFITDSDVGSIDGDYQIDDPEIRALLRRISKRGHEIGLHPNYDSYQDADRIRDQFARLKRVCLQERLHQQRWGGRQHFLRWSNPSTWQHWEDAGLNYDSTLTFADAVGFRCGVCYEYPVFNLHTRKRLKLIERPLVAMEVTLSKYMQYGWDAAAQKLERLADYCRYYHGDMTLLWQNSNLLKRADRLSYQRIIDLLA
jgi:hypothetical protein